MQRRAFLETMGLGALGALGGGALLEGCAESRTLEPATDAGPLPTDAASTSDALIGDAGLVAYTVTEAFTVFLNDPSCSGHDHACDVSPATYTDDTPVPFLGGSHLVLFRPSELVRMQNGEQLPFATSGDGPGHGHCGLAWRDGLFTASRTRVDACTTLPPADGGPLAICELRPHA